MRMVRVVCVTCGVERGPDGKAEHSNGCSGKYLPHWRPVIKEFHK